MCFQDFPDLFSVFYIFWLDKIFTFRQVYCVDWRNKCRCICIRLTWRIYYHLSRFNFPEDGIFDCFADLFSMSFIIEPTARKMSKYGVFSGPYFSVFSPNTGKYGPEKTPYLDTFYAVTMKVICQVTQYLLIIFSIKGILIVHPFYRSKYRHSRTFYHTHIWSFW